MRRFTLSLSVVVTLLIGLVATMDRSTNAQEATPESMATMMAMATHPVVGGWQWENFNEDGTSFFTYAAFHPDGTYVESFGEGGTDIGVWKPTGARTADLTLYSADVDPDPDVTVPVVSRQAIAVDETGKTITGDGIFQGFGEDGSIIFEGPGISRGTRLEVLPVVPLGTPAAATPTP